MLRPPWQAAGTLRSWNRGARRGLLCRRRGRKPLFDQAAGALRGLLQAHRLGRGGPPRPPSPAHTPRGVLRIMRRRRAQGGLVHFLVQLGQLRARVTPLLGAKRRGKIRQGGPQLGGLVKITVRSSPARAASRSLRWRAFMGRKPSNTKRPVAWPLTASAVTQALGPGTGATRNAPFASASRTITSPDPRWRACPRRCTARAALARLDAAQNIVSPLLQVVLIIAHHGLLSPRWLSSFKGNPGVLGGNKIRAAKGRGRPGVRSSRFPMGVPTMYRVPCMALHIPSL